MVPNKLRIIFLNEDTDFHKSLVEQADKFLKYGGGDYKKFIDENTDLIDGMTEQEIIDLYEYSGTGTLGDTDEERESYKTLAIQILEGKYRKAVEQGEDGDDFLYNMLIEYGTGSNNYAKTVIEHYNTLVNKKRNKNKKKKKKEIMFPGIKDPLLRKRLLMHMNKA